MYRIAQTLCTIAIALTFIASPAAAQTDAAGQPVKPVLFLLADGFNGDEFYQPYFALQAVGYRVVIAGPERGTIESPYDDPNLDATADIALDEVDPDDYLALFIAGGGSPENLEEHPESMEICRAFFEADKPVATICHGPRLLLRAGLLRDRVHSGLWHIKDELPDEWTSDELGAYVDEAVVVDGNLVSSRYPWDCVPLVRRTRRMLADAAGEDFDARNPRIAVVDPRSSRLDRWAYQGALPAAGAELEHLPLWKVQRFMESEDYRPGDFRMLVVLSGEENDKLVGDENVRELLDDFASANVSIAVVGEVYGQLVEAGVVGDDVLRPEGSHGEILASLLSDAKRGMPYPQPVPPRPATAAIVLDHGFDGRVFAAAKSHLQAQGHEVLVVGPEAGWLRGLNGTPAEVQSTFEDSMVADDAVIVAVGGLWPEEYSNIDQRVDWLLDRYDAGATIVAVGFDSLYLGRQERFKGRKFATSAQARWSFQGAGGYTDVEVAETAERLITAKGFEQVARAMKLLEEHQDE
ncbi:MAG: DJ-1/PfpI family protein [Phycisphaerae bacterium]